MTTKAILVIIMIGLHRGGIDHIVLKDMDQCTVAKISLEKEGGMWSDGYRLWCRCIEVEE
jgi:hypothetical protein